MIDIGVPVATAAIALFLGFLFGRWRRPGLEDASDWRVRLAARDRDLSEAMDRLVDAELALQLATEQQGADPADSRIKILTEELAEAEDELARLRALGVDRAPAEGGLARRMETLEAELATLQSFRCPDPAAHRGGRVGNGRTAAPRDRGGEQDR